MARLINADKYPCQTCNVSYCHQNCEKFIAWFNETVDAVEVVHGRWIMDKLEIGNPYDGNDTMLVDVGNCSACGYRCEMLPTMNYCPNCGEDCPGWEKKIVTNADWIRSMTEKELAEFIGHNSLCDRVQGEGGNWCNDHNCTDCLEEWLKQPAEIPEDDC